MMFMLAAWMRSACAQIMLSVAPAGWQSCLTRLERGEEDEKEAIDIEVGKRKNLFTFLCPTSRGFGENHV